MFGKPLLDRVLSHFGECPGFAIHDHTRTDIHGYTISRLFEASIGLRQATYDKLSSQQQNLVELVTNKARGVFIWVKLVVDMLSKGFRDGTPLLVLQETVSQLPEELRDLYSHTLRRIDSEYAEKAYIMLQIALCSISPLPLRDFIQSIVYTSQREQASCGSFNDMIRLLTSRSGGLLEAVSSNPVEREEAVLRPSLAPFHRAMKEICSVVQFIHQTAKEFVRDQKNDIGLRFLDNGKKHRNQSGYLFLLNIAVESHLGKSEFLQLSGRFKSGEHVFQYASLAEKEANLDPEKSQYIASSMGKLKNQDMHNFNFKSFGIAQTERDFYWNLFKHEDISNSDKFLFLCIAANLYSYVTCTADKPVTVLPFAMATLGPKIIPGEGDRLQMMSLLMSSDIINHVVETRFFNLTTIRMYRDPQFTTFALLLASKRIQYKNGDQHIAIAKFLLQRGADPNTRVPQSSPKLGSFTLSALQHCTMYESAIMVRLLLQHGADSLPILPAMTRHSIPLSDSYGAMQTDHSSLAHLRPYVLASRRMNADVLRTFREVGWSCTKIDDDGAVPDAIYSCLSTFAGFPAVLEVEKLREARRIEAETFTTLTGQYKSYEWART